MAVINEQHIAKQDYVIANETKIAKLKADLSSAIRNQDLLWFKECVTEAEGMNVVLANIFSPLMVKEAISSTSPEMLKIMLENGADANHLYEKGSTPLHIAASSGKVEIARVLLESGAGVNAQDDYGLTALDYATWAENGLSLAKLLLGHGANIKATTKRGFTALHSAVDWKGTVEMVNYLLDRGADIEAISKDGFTALHLAAKEGRSEIVSYLVDRGANINARTQDGYTVLHLAASNSPQKTVQLLVDRGANINARTQDGYTVLHIAASNGPRKTVQLLVDRGANINARDTNGRTPLHAAFLNLNPYSNWPQPKSLPESLQILLNHGASINARDTNGRTPLHTAVLNLGPFSKKRIEMIKILLNNGADIYDRTTNGETVLHLASSSGRLRYKDHDNGLKAVQFLVDSGADVNARNIYCSTPLHEAALNGHPEMVKLLVSNNITDVNALDSNGKTPLDLAIQVYKRVNVSGEHLDLAILQGYKAYNSRVTTKETMLDVQERYAAIEALLRDHGAQTNLTSLSTENGNCTSTVTEVPFVNNTVTSSLPLPLPSTPRSAISGSSRDFSQSVPEDGSFMALAIFAFAFLGVGVVVSNKMRARTKSQDVQLNVEMGEGLLDGKINSAAANLHEGIKKFGAYSDTLPRSSLNDTNTSQGVGLQR